VRGAELPLGSFAVAAPFQDTRAGVAGGNRPAEEGGEGLARAGDREDTSSPSNTRGQDNQFI
jgi:hypothetical protein